MLYYLGSKTKTLIESKPQTHLQSNSDATRLTQTINASNRFLSRLLIFLHGVYVLCYNVDTNLIMMQTLANCCLRFAVDSFFSSPMQRMIKG
jgi:hypothetical protein